MSNLLNYLTKYFPAEAWHTEDTKFDNEAAEENAPEIPSSGGKQYRRKNHVKETNPHEVTEYDSSNKWAVEDVKRVFMENFGVSVRVLEDRISPDRKDQEVPYSCHFLFKYYVILQAKTSWLEDTTGVLADCRGTIMQCISGSEWRIASRPFEKFFNQQEASCPVHDAAAFNAHALEYEYVEKADGTMMVLWFRYQRGGPSFSTGSWQWSTSTGLIADPRWVQCVSPFFYVKSAYNLSALASSSNSNSASTSSPSEVEIILKQNWNVVDEPLLNIERTYVFELCTKESQVITRYPTERIILLGSIHSTTSEVETQDEVDALARKLGVKRPKRFTASEQKISTLQQALNWVEEKAKDSASFGEWPEGFVVYHREKPICKMKNRAYNDRHVFYANDTLHMRNAIIERYFAGTVDDVIQFCLPPIVAFVEEMRLKVQKLMDQAVEHAHRLASSASQLHSNPPSNINGAWYELITHDSSLQSTHVSRFFVRRSDLFLAPEQPSDTTVREAVVAWLSSNWKTGSLLDYWKSSEVPEIVEEERIRYALNQKPKSSPNHKL